MTFGDGSKHLNLLVSADSAGSERVLIPATPEVLALKETNNKRNGLPWAVARSKYVPLGSTTEEVQEWRAKQAARRKPSTFKDYCAAHGRCDHCESTGIVLDERHGGFRLARSYEGVELFERCPACEGTGVRSSVVNAEFDRLTRDSG